MSLVNKNLNEDVANAAAKGSKGFYSITLKRFHKANGNVVKPDEDGLFVPNDQEELDILTHHLEQGRVSLDVPTEDSNEQDPE